MSEVKRTYFRVLTAPYGTLPPQVEIDWEFSQTPWGDQTGPFPAPHLRAIGVQVAGLGSGFRRNVPPDRIVFERSAAWPLRDFEPAGSNWLVSRSAREILQSVAQASVDFAEPDVFLRGANGDEQIGDRWLCDIVRFEDAVDEDASTINWDTRTPQYGMGSKLVMKRDLPADLHLFRISKRPDFIACSRVLRDALAQAKMTGLMFEQF